MIRSMTAFERREAQYEWGTLVWELRSVNHRYLDIFVRMPEEMRAIEPGVRETIGKRLQRGKMEANLRYKPIAGVSTDIEINIPFARKVVDACQTLDALAESKTSMNGVNLLRYPGVINEVDPDLGPIHKAALELLDKTLDGFIETREREGAKMAEIISQRAEGMATHVKNLREHRPNILVNMREKLQKRLADLDVEVEPGRLEQELVIQAQRLDVDEEFDRLDTHLSELTRVLTRDEPVGRRLDFLMQELNRETNTLGSKSNDAETTAATVDMKVLIEQMREQIQNIE